MMRPFERNLLAMAILFVLALLVVVLTLPGCSSHELEVGWNAGMKGRGLHYAVGYGRALDTKEGNKPLMPVGFGQVDEKKMLDDPNFWEGWSDAMAGLPMQSAKK